MPSEFDQLLHVTAQPAASGVLQYLNQFSQGASTVPTGIDEAANKPYVIPQTSGSTSPEGYNDADRAALLDSLKHGGITYGDTLEPEMKALISQRDDQRFVEDVGSQIQDLSDQNAKLRAQVQRQSVYATTTMNLQGEEWEVPLSLGGLSEDDIRTLGTDVTKWPEDLRNDLEDRARYNLDNGYDPFGNPIDQQQNQGQQEDLGLYDDLPGSLK